MGSTQNYVATVGGSEVIGSEGVSMSRSWHHKEMAVVASVSSLQISLHGQWLLSLSFNKFIKYKFYMENYKDKNYINNDLSTYKTFISMI